MRQHPIRQRNPPVAAGRDIPVRDRNDRRVRQMLAQHVLDFRGERRVQR